MSKTKLIVTFKEYMEYCTWNNFSNLEEVSRLSGSMYRTVTALALDYTVSQKKPYPYYIFK